MKTNIAIAALAACTLTSQANILHITEHNYSVLEFYVSPPNPGQAREVYFGITGTGLEQSLADVRQYLGIDGVNVGVLWINYSYTQSDDFVLTSGGPVGFGGTSATYQPITGNWLFRYENPVGIIPPQVPDNGGTLIGLGAALLGLWRLSR
jgi:hypothetical protein